jgi:hypothetical protein
MRSFSQRLAESVNADQFAKFGYQNHHGHAFHFPSYASGDEYLSVFFSKKLFWNQDFCHS